MTLYVYNTIPSKSYCTVIVYYRVHIQSVYILWYIV